ncbi:hypothetical protein WKW80_26990 [Variovorax humicola]|uniref:Pyocin activator protein PrtN n=1 Tax=Variovorax humicola TaxID=1769758 RepID=A0ABU8W6F9_9BURK
MIDDPMPYGKWTRKHIESHELCPYKEGGSLQTMINYRKDGFPQLEPVMRLYGTFLYDPGDVLAWFTAVDAWKAAEPIRRKAKEEAEARRQKAITDADMARIALQQEVLNADHAAQAKYQADRQEWLRSQG